MSVLSAISSKTKKFWPSSFIKEGVINAKLIMLGVLGILLLLIGGVFDGQNSQNRSEGNTVTQKVAPSPVVSNRSYEEALEVKLSNLLSQVRGAGSVAVSVTLENSGNQEHAKNVIKENKTVQEKDNAGGVRTTSETKETEQILLSKENGADKPVMVRETKPVIKGVLVIAEGAYDSTVKANLTKAVEAGLGISSYKITVLPQRK